MRLLDTESVLHLYRQEVSTFLTIQPSNGRKQLRPF